MNLEDLFEGLGIIGSYSEFLGTSRDPWEHPDEPLGTRGTRCKFMGARGKIVGSTGRCKDHKTTESMKFMKPVRAIRLMRPIKHMRPRGS